MKSLIEFFIPVSKLVNGRHPSFFIFFIFKTFLGVPSGYLLSSKILPVKPVSLDIFFAKFIIDISLPVPIFIGSASEYLFIILKLLLKNHQHKEILLMAYQSPRL